ncbi:hypothetical protein [Mucilaginibacter sp. UYCu711]|uniref:hypothetical protein n=1 Tax=Mucilaginibacter sp. UYCu711 TaxID=3156339 RepID=UPI003D1F0E71
MDFTKNKFDQVLTYLFNNPDSEGSLEGIPYLEINKIESMRITYLLFMAGFITGSIKPTLTNKGEVYVKGLGGSLMSA